MVKRIVVMAALCLLLPVATRAWSPETVYGERGDLPAKAQALLPEDVEFAYAYPVADMLYVWAKDLDGKGTALVFRELNGAYTLLLRSSPLGSRGGFAPKLGYSGKDFYTIAYSDDFSFSFHPGLDGRWMLGTAFNYGKTDCFITAYPHAAVEFLSDRYGFRRVYGTWTRSLYADALEVSVLPLSLDDALKILDTTGWAMVRAEGPQTPVPLLAAPSGEGAVLGLYYTGAPARVLEVRDAWYRVEIAGAEGWLPADALVFGEDMREIETEFPSLVYTEAALARGDILHAAPDADSEIVGAVGGDTAETPDIVGGLEIIGIVNGTWYHVVNMWGEYGYIECAWYYEGNG